MSEMKKPVKRPSVRLRCGMAYDGILRKLLWIKMNRLFASTFTQEPLPFSCVSHRTVLLRQLKDVEMWLQENKKINLTLAAQRPNGVLVKPGEIFREPLNN